MSNQTTSNQDNKSAIKLSAVSFKPNGVDVLKNINLTVERGELFPIIGRTGSGKSTLIRMINRLSDADSGTVSVLGKDINDWHVQLLRRTACMIPQSFALPNVKVDEIFKYASSILGKSYNEDQVKEMLERVELPADILEKKTGSLSGGEKQRIVTLRTLLAQPQILLADEPTANLDPASSRIVANIMQSFVTEGKTVIWITHDPTLASKYSKNGVLIHKGRIIASGDLNDLSQREEYQE